MVLFEKNMVTNNQARIIGVGSYLPKTVLTNADLEKMVETSDEWIVTRTGIQERRIAGPEECTSDMGLEAGKLALSRANMNPNEVDLILVATMSPDYLVPSTACIIQGKLGAYQAAAFDIQAACSGYVYGLSIAKSFIESGQYKNILFIASEKMSSFIDYTDRNTCVLFGDGATAAVISNKGSGLAIDSMSLGSDGKFFQTAIIPAGGAKNPTSSKTLEAKEHFFRMEGKEVFKHAVRRMEQAANDCLQKAGLTQEDINWIIPHQANMRIIDALCKAFSNKNIQICRTVQNYGNTSASSIGIALDELLQSHSIKLHEKILLVAFGVGFNWGATLLSKIDG